MSAGRRLEEALADSLRVTAEMESMSPLMRLRLERESAYGSGLRAVERVARYRWKAEHAPDEFERTAAALAVPHDEADAERWQAEVRRLDAAIREAEGCP